MGIDTSIYALGQRRSDPVDAFMEGARNAKSNKLLDLQISQQNALAAEQKRSLGERNALMGITSDASNYDERGNLKRSALPKIGAAAPGQYATYQKSVSEQEKAMREQEKADLENKFQTFQKLGQIIGSAKDQASYEQALMVAKAMGMDVSREPAIFDPNHVQQALQMTLTGAQQVEQLWKKKGYDLEVQKAQEDARHNKAGEANAAAQVAASRANNAATVAATTRGQDMTDKRERDLNGVKPLNEFQSKSAAFGDRAQKANAILGEVEGKYSPAAINSKNSVQDWPIIGGMAGAAANSAMSSTDQRAEQAQRDFVNAVLRQESGAAIGLSEFQNAARQYFPQPGDSKEVIKQKAKNRQTAIEGLIRGAGPNANVGKSSPSSALPDGWGVEVH